MSLDKTIAAILSIGGVAFERQPQSDALFKQQPRRLRHVCTCRRSSPIGLRPMMTDGAYGSGYSPDSVV